MFNIVNEETYQDGQVIFEEGKSGDWIYIIESGAVEMFKRAGEENFVIDILQPGDVFGEIAFFARMPRPASAKAKGTTVLGVIDRTVVDKEFNKLSSDFRMLLKSLVLKLLKVNEKACTPQLHRKSPRVPKVINLKYKSREGFIKALSGNLSPGGIFIKTSTPYAIGEQFVLNLKLPDSDEAITIKCEVSWSREEKNSSASQPPGMGAKFTEISPADKQKLKKELIRGGS